jgi:hypothetical protein
MVRKEELGGVARILTSNKLSYPYRIHEGWTAEGVFGPLLQQYPALDPASQMQTTGYHNEEGVECIVFVTLKRIKNTLGIGMEGISFENCREKSLGYILLTHAYVQRTEVFHCETNGPIEADVRRDLAAPLSEVSFDKKLDAAYKAATTPFLRVV